MSGIGKTIDGVVKLGAAHMLKQAGFKKSGRNFHLVGQESIAVINVQASQGNGGQEGRFTLNVGRYYPSIAEQMRGSVLPGLPKEYECTIRKRIGCLMPQRMDLWWTVTSGEDNTQVVRELENALHGHALPWLMHTESIAGLAEFLGGETSFDAADILNTLGDKAGAIRCLQRLLAAIPTDWQRIETWAHRRGLDLEKG